LAFQAILSVLISARAPFFLDKWRDNLFQLFIQFDCFWFAKMTPLGFNLCLLITIPAFALISAQFSTDSGLVSIHALGYLTKGNFFLCFM
jgi:hypothetical protein